MSKVVLAAILATVGFGCARAIAGPDGSSPVINQDKVVRDCMVAQRADTPTRTHAQMMKACMDKVVKMKKDAASGQAVPTAIEPPR